MTLDNPSHVPLAAPSAVGGAPAEPPWRNRRGLVLLLILAALAVFPYLNTLRNGFVYDDTQQVKINPYIHDFRHLREIFTSSVWSFMGDFRGASNYYRPVMSVGYLLCYQVFGLRPWGYHLANLLLNLAVVLVVCLVTRRMFASAAVAMVAACIYALHPIHSEAVDWIAAVTELELALFYLLAFWFFLSSARAAGKCSAARQAGMAGCFALALLSKEQALTLPLLATLYEHFFCCDRAQTTWEQKRRRYGLLWLLAAGYLAARIHFLGELAPSFSRQGLGVEDVAISAFSLFSRYCWKLLWPANLCAYYVFPNDVGTLIPSALSGLLALGFCALAFWALGKLDRQAAFGVLWLCLTLAPVLNVHWMPGNPFAERYLYLASVGFCWMAGSAALHAWRALSARGMRLRWALPAMAGIAATLCLYQIVMRNREWRDDVTFYTVTLAQSPGADYIHNNLGTAYWEQGDKAAAAKEWRAALKSAPTNEYALHNLGLVADDHKDYRLAERLFLAALGIRPNYADVHLDLGKVYASEGRLEEAEVQLRAAESLAPLNIRVHNALSEFYMDRRSFRESEAEARRSVEIQPSPQGYWDLGLAVWAQGKRAGAEQAFLQAENLSPADSRSHFMLGLFYMDSRRTADAIRQYRAGLQIDPANGDAQANLQKLEGEAGGH